jgi:hypothetical protein
VDGATSLFASLRLVERTSPAVHTYRGLNTQDLFFVQCGAQSELEVAAYRMSDLPHYPFVFAKLRATFFDTRSQAVGCLLWQIVLDRMSSH